MMLASVPGSGPRAGLCSGPSWGPHSRSGPAPPRLHHGELAQGPCKVPSLSTTSQPSAWQLRSRLSRHTNPGVSVSHACAFKEFIINIYKISLLLILIFSPSFNQFITYSKMFLKIVFLCPFYPSSAEPNAVSIN